MVKEEDLIGEQNESENGSGLPLKPESRRLNINVGSVNEGRSTIRNLIGAALLSVFAHGAFVLSGVDDKAEKFDGILRDISHRYSLIERDINMAFRDGDAYKEYEKIVGGEAFESSEKFENPKDFVVNKYKKQLESDERIDMARFFGDAEWASGGVDPDEIKKFYEEVSLKRKQIEDKDLYGVALLNELSKAFSGKKYYEHDSFVSDFSNKGIYNCEASPKLVLSLIPKRYISDVKLHIYGDHLRLLYNVMNDGWYVFDQGHFDRVKLEELDNTLILPYDAFVKNYVGAPVEKRFIRGEKKVERTDHNTNTFFDLAGDEYAGKLNGYPQVEKPASGSRFEFGKNNKQLKPMEFSIVYMNTKKVDKEVKDKEIPEYVLPNNKMIEAEITGGLYLYGKEVNNLKFLKKMSGVKYLNLEKIGTKDLKYLADLPELETLYINEMDLTGVDFSFFKSLKNLKRLSIDTVSVNDISFVSSLVDLESFGFQGNVNSGKAYDLSFLSKLTKLKGLNFYNVIADNYNVISSLSELEDFRYAGEVELKNMDFLRPLKKLKTIFIDNYSGENFDALIGSRNTIRSIIVEAEKSTNVDALGELSQLDNLYFSTSAKDLYALKKLNKLESLTIDAPNADDFSFVRDLENLNDLSIRAMGAKDIDFLKNLKSDRLVRLELSKNVMLKDISCLSQFSENLLSLKIGVDKNANLESFNQMKKIKSLVIYGPVSDYKYFAGMEKLEALELASTDIQSKDLELLYDLFVNNKLEIFTLKDYKVDCPSLQIVKNDKESLKELDRMGYRIMPNKCRVK